MADELTVGRNQELVFAVLADQVRRQILDTLATNGERNVGFISDQITSLGRTTVSTHVKALKMSGVIVERKQGCHRLFSIDPAGPANDALQFLHDVLQRALSAGGESNRPPAALPTEDDAAWADQRHA